MKKQIQIAALLGLFVTVPQLSFAQIKEERLILDRKREPEVRKIEKKQTSVETEKNYPPEEKAQTPVEYNITNVPAASDFKTSVIQGEDISPEFDNDHPRNYLQAGYGNFGRFLTDANLSTDLQEDLEAGIDAHFNYTEGLKKVYSWDSYANDANVGLYLNSYGEKGKFNVNGDFRQNTYNYYGAYALQPANDQDLLQKTSRIRVNAMYDAYDNNYLNSASLKTSVLADHFNAKENLGELDLHLSKHGLDIYDDILLNIDLGAGLETARTQFEILNANEAYFLNASAHPKVTLFRGGSYLSLGAQLSYLNSKNSSEVTSEVTSEVAQNKFYASPLAEISIAATPQFNFYGGVNGGVQLNSYASFLQMNPYLVSDQILHPTNTKLGFYFGLKGDVDETLKYDVNAGFATIENEAFFKGNNLFDISSTAERKPYDFMNTFSVVYDNVEKQHVNASVSYFPLENLALDANARFEKYAPETLTESWYKPLLRADLGAKYTLLNKKLNLGAKAFFVSEQTANYYEVINSGVNSTDYQTQENSRVIPSYFDINLSASYKIHENFSIFALGNNLIGKNYQDFYRYQVLGTQIMGGVRVTF